MSTFYDIHAHAFNLSHPHLSSFLIREDLIDNLIDEAFGGKTRGNLFLASIAPKNTIKKVIGKKLASFKEQVNNTLAFYEVPLEYQLLVLDHFLKSGSPAVFNEKKQIEIGDKAYNKIVLCPLVIDFGYKSIPKNEKDGVFYNLTPKRPIVNQVGDLLYAIRTYYRFNLVINSETKKMNLSPEIPDFETRKNEKLFEIYPFMGLDTRNYTLEQVQDMLEKYFKNFTKDESAETRRKRLFEKMGKLDSNMYVSTPDYYTDIFAGIKLYPQIGFDPYPDDVEEREKVDVLYQFCIDKRIPIISHCSDGGYKVGDYDALTAPAGRWKKVLEAYPELTLDFAHFGSQKNDKKATWRNAIIDLVGKYPNVYSDISCNDATANYYNELEKLFNGKNSALQEKLLYGSDFSINLLVVKIKSYNEYLKAFLNAKLSYKNNLCELNPKRFLFGK